MGFFTFGSAQIPPTAAAVENRIGRPTKALAIPHKVHRMAATWTRILKLSAVTGADDNATQSIDGFEVWRVRSQALRAELDAPATS
jgi:hypothetical protein